MEIAIQKDCEYIIERFIANENPRFESFVFQWKSTMFQSIYTGQSIAVEIIQSTNACIHFAKRILCSKNVMPRLGALFLLYAIHFKQPTHRFHKIDIDLNTWIQIKEFIFSLDNMMYAEGAKCIFWELLKEDAFRFVASDTYHGLENLVDLDKIRTSVFSINRGLYALRNDFKNFTDEKGIFAGIEKLQNGYNQIKELINNSCTVSKRHFNVPMSNCFADLKNAFNNLQSFIITRCLEKKKKKKISKGIKKTKRYIAYR